MSRKKYIEAISYMKKCIACDAGFYKQEFFPSQDVTNNKFMNDIIMTTKQHTDFLDDLLFLVRGTLFLDTFLKKTDPIVMSKIEKVLRRDIHDGNLLAKGEIKEYNDKATRKGAKKLVKNYSLILKLITDTEQVVKSGFKA
ncbi:hypothetical protein ACED34_23495 [Vibrio splendidus]|uniref:hypothetical protein n=1 Tax=Vibrio splendidus TaxID=29497 RepID=UPI00352CC1BD